MYNQSPSVNIMLKPKPKRTQILTTTQIKRDRSRAESKERFRWSSLPLFSSTISLADLATTSWSDGSGDDLAISSTDLATTSRSHRLTSSHRRIWRWPRDLIASTTSSSTFVVPSAALPSVLDWSVVEMKSAMSLGGGYGVGEADEWWRWSARSLDGALIKP